ncbi:hypothetical protein PMI41_03179 [Phyllobacterium sp. YR531]|nr:hypothetical protein PMI41_03179 [Phyllobacterium sp. YR531]
MGLGTLIIMIMIGLPVAILATHFAGGSRRPSLQTDDQTASIFQQDFPEETISRIIYSSDRRTAFLLLTNDRIGIVHGFGNRFLTRDFARDDILSAEPIGQAGLKLTIRDFTWPGSTFSFSDTASRDVALGWLATKFNPAEDMAHDRIAVL